MGACGQQTEQQLAATKSQPLTLCLVEEDFHPGTFGEGRQGEGMLDYGSQAQGHSGMGWKLKRGFCLCR